jgi:hypothetical protein
VSGRRARRSGELGREPEGDADATILAVMDLGPGNVADAGRRTIPTVDVEPVDELYTTDVDQEQVAGTSAARVNESMTMMRG